MCIVASFVIVKTWKQLKCPSAGKYIKKQWDIHTVEYYLATRRNKLLMHTSS